MSDNTKIKTKSVGGSQRQSDLVVDDSLSKIKKSNLTLLQKEKMAIENQRLAIFNILEDVQELILKICWE